MCDDVESVPGGSGEHELGDLASTLAHTSDRVARRSLMRHRLKEGVVDAAIEIQPGSTRAVDSCDHLGHETCRAGDKSSARFEHQPRPVRKAAERVFDSTRNLIEAWSGSAAH